MPLPIEKDVDMLMQSIVLDSLAGEWEEHVFIGDVVYLFMSDERCIRFKMVVTAENCKREDQEFWVETPPNDITYKLELLEEYEGTMLSEQELSKHGFNGGRSLEVPCCNNKELIGYIKSIF